jgi:hypothetical protein
MLLINRTYVYSCMIFCLSPEWSRALYHQQFGNFSGLSSKVLPTDSAFTRYEDTNSINIDILPDNGTSQAERRCNQNDGPKHARLLCNYTTRFSDLIHINTTFQNQTINCIQPTSIRHDKNFPMPTYTLFCHSYDR